MKMVRIGIKAVKGYKLLYNQPTEAEKLVHDAKSEFVING